MGKRKLTILEPAVNEVADVAFYIEGKGMSETAKKFVDEAFLFFEHLADEAITHRPCKYEVWNLMGYRCANFKKKYVVAYLDNSHEVIICDFGLQKVLY
jgi:hypothetical protein